MIEIEMSRKYAFLPCGDQDFESAASAQNDEFKAVSIARIFTLVKRENIAETQYLAGDFQIRSLNAFVAT